MASLHVRHLLCEDGNANGIQKENQKEQQVWLQTRRQKTLMSGRRGLYANINARKKKGISRPKSKSTITPKAYKNMQAGFPKKKKK